MNNRNRIGLAAIGAVALIALLGVHSASATTLEVGGEPKNEQVTITASLESGTSAILKNTSGSVQNTCNGSHVHGNTQSPYTETFVTGPVTSLSFSGCTRPVTVHDPGKLEIHHIAGTTNGTVYSEGATVTTEVPLFGYITCRTHETTHIGTLTGSASGHATLHVNAVLNCGAIPSARWEATYLVTSPTGLGTIEGTTTLEVGGEPKNEQVTITASLESGTSAILKNTSGSVQNTCNGSHVHGNTQSPYTETFVTGPVTSLSFSGCTRPVTVHDPGKLEIHHIAGTTNGTVYSEGATVTTEVPLFGYITCRTHETTHIGTLTGSASGHATLHVNAVLNCGAIPSARWEATYLVTSPTGLGTIEGTTTLEVGGEPKNEQVTITASLESGTSAILKNTSGSVQNTCNGSHVHGNTQSPYTETFVTGPVTSLSFSGCTRPVTVHDPGKLEIHHIAGTTNGTVYSEGATVTTEVPLFGYITCRTHETTHIGTLTGSASGHATLHVNAVLNCGAIPSARWEATYLVTSPTGLGVSA